MERIFTVGFSEEIATQLGFPILEIPNLIDNDIELHDFVINIFKNNEIDKLIIDLSSNPVQNLKLAYHIRLSLVDLGGKSLIPILFSASQSLESLLKNCSKWIQILTTKGIYFTALNLVKIDVVHIESLKGTDYKTGFLDLIHISSDELQGKHSVANQWGAFAMDKAAGTNVLFYNETLKKTFSKLYFKFIQAFQFNYGLLNQQRHAIRYVPVGTPNIVDSKNKRILLIDDEAEKGWDIVLRKIFKNAEFHVINEKVSSYEAFSPKAKNLILNGKFDLFLVDLRLNGVQEEDYTPIKNFSGANVLTEIKRQNNGNQVIMFTASNKAWNIKPLLDLGADAFYIKESPEYLFSSKISESNYLAFRNDVKICFEKDYLKNIYSNVFALKNRLQISKASYNQKFLDEIQVLLYQAFNMHYNAKDDKQHAYSYLTLYMILESLNNQFFEKRNDDSWAISDSSFLLDWKWDDKEGIYCNTGTVVKGNKPPEWQKLAGLYFQKWKLADSDFIKNIYFLIQKRNGFVHNDEALLNKKNTKGNYVNHDIFNKEGFQDLFKAVSVLINLL